MDIRSSEQASGSKMSGQALSPDTTKHKGPRLPSVETEVSSGVLGRGSCGPLRHASSADWFMA